MQFHPVAYIVKLNIEMSMADLITKVARDDQKGPSGGKTSSKDPRAAVMSWTGLHQNEARIQGGKGHSRITSGGDERGLEAYGKVGQWASYEMRDRKAGAGRNFNKSDDATVVNVASKDRTDSSSSSSTEGLFDDRHESQTIDFATMMRQTNQLDDQDGGRDSRHRQANNQDGAIMKTVEYSISTER